jgi:hypothetical protein
VSRDGLAKGLKGLWWAGGKEAGWFTSAGFRS